MKKKFKTLAIVSKSITIIGFISIIIGILYIIYEGIYEPNLPNHSFFLSDFIEIIYGIGFSIYGLLMICFSQLVQVLLRIEINTRKEK